MAPANRLVARTLERPWDEAFASEEQRKADHRRCLAAQPVTLAARDREAMRRLARALPALWHAETTTAAARQAIMRHLGERVVVPVQGEREPVELEVQGSGGHRTQTRRRRRHKREKNLVRPGLVAGATGVLLALAMAIPETGACRDSSAISAEHRGRPSRSPSGGRDPLG